MKKAKNIINVSTIKNNFTFVELLQPSLFMMALDTEDGICKCHCTVYYPYSNFILATFEARFLTAHAQSSFRLFLQNAIS